MAVQRFPGDDSREAGEKKPHISQLNMYFLVMRDTRLASVAALNVFFGWSHSLKM